MKQENIMGILTGKKALILGTASERSIAAGVARAMHQAGAEIALTYQGERLKGRVTKLATELGGDIVLPCDVTDSDAIGGVADQIKERWNGLDILVHSIAYASGELLKGKYLDNLTRAGFLESMEISSYSFAAFGKAFWPLMKNRGASMLTMSYLGAERVIPNYNVMGVAKASLEANVRYMAADLGEDDIRVNAISSGPIRTLAASGIKGFISFLEVVREKAPLRRNVSIEEVGNTATFLCSDQASAITGEVLHVDCGFNIVGA